MPDAFEELYDALKSVKSLEKPWMVAGGYAVDLFLRRITRTHKDIDVAIFREDQFRLQSHLRGWRLEKAHKGRLETWNPAEYIELPVHGIWAWCPGSYSNEPDIEFLLNERSGDSWLFRKEPAVRLEIDKACLHSQVGIPYLAPQIVLLYKSYSPRESDEADLSALLPQMSPDQREWLRTSLRTVQPGHTWLEMPAL